MSIAHDFRPDRVLKRAKQLKRKLDVLGDLTFDCTKIGSTRPIKRRMCGMRWHEHNPDRRSTGRVALGQGHIGSSCTLCPTGEAHAAGRLPDGTEQGASLSPTPAPRHYTPPGDRPCAGCGELTRTKWCSEPCRKRQRKLRVKVQPENEP